MPQTPPPAAAERLALRWAAGRRRVALLAATLMGAVAALGQAPVEAWPLSVIGFGALYGLYTAAPTSRRAGLIGWAGGTGYFLVALSWIVEPFLVDVARHGWMAPFALVFLAGGLALFWGGALALAQRAGGQALAFIAALTLAEALRGWIFTGFPWAQPGHIWVGTPVMPLAAWTGALGLTVVTLVLGVLIWLALGGRRLIVAAVVLAQAAFLMMPQRDGPSRADAPVVRLVQPNAPQHEKWKPEMIPIFFNRQIGFTAADPRPDLVVWPETAIPTALERAQEPIGIISSAAGDIPVVFGALRFEGPQRHNSLAVIDWAGTLVDIYDKHHLVPFGEYLPFGNLLGRIGLKGLAAEDGNGYSAGPGPRLIDMGDLGRALPLICYEAVFPRDVGGVEERADFLLLITNDAWFGRISGPYQHLAQARLRAVEQGLPMIRVANTGVSAMIDARGQITASLPLNEAGYIDAKLPEALPPTFYARTGDLAMLVLLLLIFGGSYATRGRRGPVL